MADKKTTPAGAQLTDDEVREAFALIKKKRDERKAAYEAYSQRPEVKARQERYRAEAKAKREAAKRREQAVLDAAAKLGLEL